MTRDQENQIVAQARAILRQRLTRPARGITGPDSARAYVTLALADREAESFHVTFLDNRHRVIAHKEMFRGTVYGSAVYPREVVKAALRHNASAVIFAHNHPSGVAEPSRADDAITKRLTDALHLVDVRVLDHFIVYGSDDAYSYAEAGKL